MRVKRIILFVLLITLLSLSNSLFKYSTNKVSIFKLPSFASGCSKTGTGSSVVTTLTATEKTSGIDSWKFCTSSTSSTCSIDASNSSNCSTYKITGWPGYLYVQTTDNAGNKSNVTAMYKYGTLNYSGTRSNSISFVLENKGNNIVYVTSKTANKGNINSISYNKDGTINITGNAYKNTTTDIGYENATTGQLYSCNEGGTLEYKNGKWTCTAESYRLQNYTCICVYKKVNGKYQVAWDSAPGVCINKKTYCSDKYDPDSSDYNYQFQVVSAHAKTSSELSSENAGNAKIYDSNGNLIAQGDWSSKHFTRPSGDVYYTYYADFPAQIFYSSWYTKTYSDFPSGYFDSKYYNNNTYNLYAGKLKSSTELAYIGNLKTESDISKFQSSVKTKLVNYAKAGHLYSSSSAIAYNSTSKYNNSAGWFVSTAHPGDVGQNSVCDHLLNAINDGTFKSTLNTRQFTYPYETGSGDYPVYVAPIISSAACNWNEYVNENVPYSTCVKDEVNNKVYCCKNSSVTPVLRDGYYQCQTSTTVTNYQYDYTIGYYKK